MKKIPMLIKKWFSPKALQGLDLQELMGAMADSTVRQVWISDLYDEIQRLNLEVDNRLLGKATDLKDLTDLAARRKAYHDVLVGILSARRRVKGLNPQSGKFDLDSVTVLPVE